MKIGVLGGTFNPVHNGHIAIAEAVAEKLGLDKVLLVPASHPPMKGRDGVLEVERRNEMVRLAIQGHPALQLSMVETGRPGLSYTGDTIADLSKNLAEEDELYFIIGWDNLEQFTRWHEPERILQLSRLVAVPRPGYGLPDMDALEKALPGICERLIVLDGPEIDISASEIRRKVAEGRPVGHLMPEAVSAYIKENRLYR